jgi:hypothetical protein
VPRPKGADKRNGGAERCRDWSKYHGQTDRCDRSDGNGRARSRQTTDDLGRDIAVALR